MSIAEDGRDSLAGDAQKGCDHLQLSSWDQPDKASYPHLISLYYIYIYTIYIYMCVCVMCIIYIINIIYCIDKYIYNYIYCIDKCIYI